MHVEGLDGLTGEEVRTVLDSFRLPRFRWPMTEIAVGGWEHRLESLKGIINANTSH